MIGVIVSIIALWSVYIVLSARQRRALCPSKPFRSCLIDSFLDLFVLLKLGIFAKPQTYGGAIKAAMKSTKLSDFGHASQAGSLEKYDLVRKVGFPRSGVKYSPIGHIILNETLTRRVEVRLRLVDYIKKNNEVGKIAVKPPIFVIGFPRTGTTFLHEMLGLHETVQSHFSWEQVRQKQNLI